MAYPKPRSASSELQQGVNEGSDNYQGKDWGGRRGGFDPHDCGCPGDCKCGCAEGKCVLPHDPYELAMIR